MTHEQLLEPIVADPAICYGKPSIRGHRIWVSLSIPDSSAKTFSNARDHYDTQGDEIPDSGTVSSRVSGDPPTEAGERFNLAERTHPRAPRAILEKGEKEA